MKKSLFFLAGAVLAMASCSQSGYVIEGTFSSDDSTFVATKAYLSSEFSDVADTVDIVGGKFIFKGDCPVPMLYAISIEGMQGTAPIFLENAKFTAEIEQKGDFLYKEHVIGGETQSVLYSMNLARETAMDAHNIEMDSFMAEYSDPQTTDERRNEMRELYSKASEEGENAAKKIKDEYLSENPVSYLALLTVYGDMESCSPDKTADAFSVFSNSEEYKSHPMAMAVSKYLEANKHLMRGQQAPDFTLPDKDGKDVTFSTVYAKNKVTMIDFWAGWCGPCRAFNPVLLEIYNKYHEKGFEVVAVSMDRDRDFWLKAIEDDKLPWIQLSEVAYWNTEPVRLYNVRYIPQNVLVDSEGKIIGTKFSEEELESVLEEYLK